MRYVIAALLLLPSPALAWQFETTPLCTVTHETEALGLEMTYDPGISEYTLELTLTSGSWRPAPVFSIRFEGAGGLTISTTSHVVDGSVLRVTDRGFGNVLNGLEFNTRAVAILGTQEYTISLEGADAPLQAFRDCDLPTV